MSVYLRGRVWQYDFWFHGVRYKGSTGQRDYESAVATESTRQLEVRRRTAKLPLDDGALRAEVTRRKRRLGADDSHSYIYFVTDGVHVKIGRSNNVQQRMVDLRTANAAKLRLLGQCAGTGTHEALLHQWFSHLRQHNEWFKVTPEVRQFIDALKALERSRKRALRAETAS